MIRNKETKKYVKSLRQNSVLIVCIVSITYYSQCTKMSGCRTCGSLQSLVKEISKKNQAAMHTVTISRKMYILNSTLYKKYLGFVSKNTMEIILQTKLVTASYKINKNKKHKTKNVRVFCFENILRQKRHRVFFFSTELNLDMPKQTLTLIRSISFFTSILFRNIAYLST